MFVNESHFHSLHISDIWFLSLNNFVILLFLFFPLKYKSTLQCNLFWQDRIIFKSQFLNSNWLFVRDEILGYIIWTRFWLITSWCVFSNLMLTTSARIFQPTAFKNQYLNLYEFKWFFPRQTSYLLFCITYTKWIRNLIEEIKIKNR